MTAGAAGRPRGLLYELEQQRLLRFGAATLDNAGALAGELVSLQVLPEVLADMLQTFRDDVRAATGAKPAVKM